MLPTAAGRVYILVVGSKSNAKVIKYESFTKIIGDVYNDKS